MAIETFTSPGEFSATQWDGTPESLAEITLFAGAARVSVADGKLFLDLRREGDPSEAGDPPKELPAGWDVRKYADGLMYISPGHVREERWTPTGA